MTQNTRWKSITRSAYAWEQDALEFIRERLPDREPYRAWANFEFIADDGSINEVDLLVLSPMGFFLVEIKSNPGVLTGDAGTWTWISDGGRRRTVDNPLIGANKKVRKLISLLRRQKPAKKADLPYLEALVFCSAPDLEVKLTGNARFRVCLRDRPSEGDRPRRDGIMAAIRKRICPGVKPTLNRPIDRRTANVISRAMEAAGIRESQRKRQVSDFNLKEIIDDGPGYQDWSAVHVRFDHLRRRIRIYPVAETASAEQRRTVERAADREAQILESLRPHPGVPELHGFAQHEELGPAIIFDYSPRAMRLDLYLAERGADLEVDDRLVLLRQIAETIGHAHQRRVVHRALSPQTILVVDPDHPAGGIKVFNWQVGCRTGPASEVSVPVTATIHVDQLVSDAGTAYMAPEALAVASEGGEHMDIFSLGAIAFHLFANRPPAENAVELSETLRGTDGLRISSVMNGAVESLQYLVQKSTHPDVTRRTETVGDFLALIDLLEEELTTPESQLSTVEDPAQAQAGDRLPGGFAVKTRLGTGASSVGFLVDAPDGRPFILKVALDPDQNDALRQEAAAIQKLHHPRVVQLERTVDLDGRVGILMPPLTRQLKGRKRIQTLREWLHVEGPPQLELLQRFGEDLLTALNHLEERGVSHRDIKPDNLAVANVGTADQLHLVLFDFSLARYPADNIRVGTRGYIDPFLTLRKYRRWDSDAERWSVAITLYEMATGGFPVWHDGKTDPAQVDCEATLDPERFQADVRDGLLRFFKKALRRDPAGRFDNADQMRRAWRRVFDALDQPTVITSTHDTETPPPDPLRTARLDSQIPELGLSTRATNALDRLNVLKVEDLLRVPIRRLSQMRGVGQKTRREITEAVRVLRERLDVQPPPDAPPDETAPLGVDQLADRLIRGQSSGDGDAAGRILRAFLGLDHGLDDPWPSQAETGRHLGVSRARVGQVLTAARNRWGRNPAMTALRSDMARILEANAGVMTIREMADAVLTARGADQDDDDAIRLARAAVRAAVELERTRKSARYAVHRAGDHPVLVTIAGHPGDESEMADYARRLGAEADRIAGEDPLLPPGRAVERLQSVPVPAEADPLAPGRLVRLATAASTRAALSSRQEIYPRGMDPARALKLSHGALVGARKLRIQDIRNWVEGRYPEAAPIPGQPDLGRLLDETGLDLRWDPKTDDGGGAYKPPSYQPSLSAIDSSRHRFTTGSTGPAVVTPEVADARQFEERLEYNRQDGGFIAMSVYPKWYVEVIPTLRKRFDLEVFHLENAFLDALETTAREKRVKWEKIVEADASPKSPDWHRLLQLVDMAMPRLEENLFSAREFRLICYAGVLARYNQMRLINELRDRAGRPPERGGVPGVWLLIPGDDQSPLPILEGQAVPVIGPGQHARIPLSWLENRHRAEGGIRA